MNGKVVFYIIIGLIMLLTFGVCFLVDKLIQRRKQYKPADTDPNRVRLPRINNILGLLLAVGGFALTMFIAPIEGGIWWVLSIGAMLIGLFLLVNYIGTGIDYDEAGFTYKRLFRSSLTFTYDQIKGQRTFANRAGINVLLYVDDEEVYLYSILRGTRGFMETAFNGWCRARGIDPDAISPLNPDAMIWFNEPVED